MNQDELNELRELVRQLAKTASQVSERWAYIADSTRAELESSYPADVLQSFDEVTHALHDWSVALNTEV